MLKSGLKVLATSYAVLLLLLILFEPTLLFPAPQSDLGEWNSARFGATECYVPSQDGAQVHVWMLAHPAPRGTILFAHGNAQHLGTLGETLNDLRQKWDANVIAFDYRGYGKTGGTPSEKAIREDSIAVAGWLKQQKPWNEVPVICMGRSLGGYAAVIAASEIDADGLILDRTFSSAVDVAAEKFPVFPVRWLMRNRFPTSLHIEEYRGPLLQLHGENDEVIPFHSGMRLHSKAPSPDKNFIQLAQLGHQQDWPESFWVQGSNWIGAIRARAESE